MMDDMLCPTSEHIIPDLSNLNSLAPSECVACATWIVPTPLDNQQSIIRKAKQQYQRGRPQKKAPYVNIAIF